MLEAISKDGHKVYLDYIEDCEDNEGGFFVMVYAYEDSLSCDYFDYFCIHTDDCDCTNYDEVEKYAVKYVADEDYSDYFNEK